MATVHSCTAELRGYLGAKRVPCSSSFEPVFLICKLGTNTPIFLLLSPVSYGHSWWFFTGLHVSCGTSPGIEKGQAPPVQGVPVIKVQGPCQVYQQGILKLPKKLAPGDAPILPDLFRLPQPSWITQWLEAALSPSGPAQAAHGEGSERRAAPIALLNSPLAGAPRSDLARRRNKSPLKWATFGSCPKKLPGDMVCPVQWVLGTPL